MWLPPFPQSGHASLALSLLGPVTVTPPDTTQNPKLAGALARGVLDQPAWPLILQLGRDCLEAKVTEPRREHGDT